MISEARKNGVYYTPSLLAKRLVEPLVNGPNLRILDPAYGDGALILAAEEVLRKRHPLKKRYNLFGCDLSPLPGKTQHLPSSNFIEANFLDYDIREQFDVILMNPPFVRHHHLDKTKIDHYQNVLQNLLPLKRTSDLWAYFMVKAAAHLRKNGSIGAILPWSFLQADYSIELRKWLAGLFREIKVLALGADLFDSAKERIVLVWLKGYKRPNKQLLLASANGIDDDVKYHVICRTYFSRDRVNICFSNDAIQIIEEYRSQLGFKCFGDCADISIGVVTGANSFFIKHEDELRAMKICLKGMVPIFTNSSEFSGFSINGNIPRERLILMTDKNADRFRNYINQGELEKHNLNSHSQRREPWYSVKTGNVPDAFFPYRVSLIPYLMLNRGNIQCTNSIHRIYFKNATNIEKKWIQVSLLSIPGQLSLEAHAKVYGCGILKIEPSSLKKALCFSSKDRSIVSVYNKLSNLLQENKKREAMKAATEFINDYLGIDAALSLQAQTAYEELLANRQRRKLKQ